MSQQLNYGLGGDRSYAQYYRHSNRAAPVGLILGGLLGLAVGLVSAVIYAYLIAFVPIIYACVLFTVLFGVVLGRVPAKIMRWGKVRSLPIVLAVVGVIAVLSYAAHWVVWVYALLNREGDFPMSQLLADPLVVFRAMRVVLDKGTWGMSKGDTVSGFFLAIVWIVEAGIIFFMAFLMAKKSQTAAPFCEKCNEWCPAGVRLRSLRLADHAALKRQMEMSDWSHLDSVGPADAGSQAFISIIHHGCPRCGMLNTLSANQIINTTDSRGRSQTKVKAIVDKLVVTPEDVQAAKLSGYKSTETSTPHSGEVGW